MKFRLAGGLEVPTWVLHAIQPMSEISSVRLKLVAKGVLEELLHGSLDMERALRFTTPKDAAADVAKTETIVAGVRYFVASAVKYAVDDDTIRVEMEQLGLPRENASAILRPYRDRKGALRAKFAADTFAVAATRPVAVARDADGAGVSLRLAAPDMDVGMSVDKFEVLLYELEQVQGVIAGMEGS
mmetsp:Transcript_6325/g.19974  ORF Transcript_6325/g.19974 Transcript_6325/m.19974 type:complete len:186 (-) Transcript_6325:10-567(-)